MTADECVCMDNQYQTTPAISRNDNIRGHRIFRWKSITPSAIAVNRYEAKPPSAHQTTPTSPLARHTDGHINARASATRFMAAILAQVALAKLIPQHCRARKIDLTRAL